MKQLPEPLAPLAAYNQFILYKLIPSKNNPNKNDKIPVNISLEAIDAHDPSQWMDATTATNAASLYGPEYGTAFVFTKDDPFFFVDIDNCLEPDGKNWSPTANAVLSSLPGAAVEISQSGRGLHIFGTGTIEDHACKNTALGLEFYTSLRFVALTGFNAIGSAATDCNAMLPALTANYFPPKVTTKGQEWTTEPCPEWRGLVDDNELIKKADSFL